MDFKNFVHCHRIVPDVPAGPLSALISKFNVTISEFSFATVSRAVAIASYEAFDGPGNALRPTNVAKLVLTVAPATNVVPEPATYVLLASGLGMLALFARRQVAVPCRVAEVS